MKPICGLMFDCLKTFEYQLLSSVILSIYAGIFGLYMTLTTSFFWSQIFYPVMYSLAITSVIGSTIYNIFDKYYDEKAEKLRYSKINIDCDPCLKAALIVLYPTLMNMPIFTIVNPRYKNWSDFFWWSLPSLIFLGSLISWPYYFEENSSYEFYIWWSLSNYVFIYTLIYNYFTLCGIKHSSVWFNPITYLYFVFWFPIFMCLPNKIYDDRSRKLAIENQKHEKLISLIQYVDDKVVDLEAYESCERAEPMQCYRSFYEFMINANEKSDTGVPEVVPRKIWFDCVTHATAVQADVSEYKCEDWEDYIEDDSSEESDFDK